MHLKNYILNELFLMFVFPHPTSRRPDTTRGGRSLRVASSGRVGARWFEDTTRMSMAVVRVALRVYAGGAWVLWDRSLCIWCECVHFPQFSTRSVV